MGESKTERLKSEISNLNSALLIFSNIQKLTDHKGKAPIFTQPRRSFNKAYNLFFFLQFVSLLADFVSRQKNSLGKYST